MSVICSLLKHVLFKGLPRPLEHFNELYPYLNLVDGVHISRLNTFPSGHSAAAFMLFALLAFQFRNVFVQFCFAVLAIITAFSRVYLFEHFLRDVLAGAFIGLGISTLTWYVYERKIRATDQPVIP
ncbi:MAG: phosphatase PAP2 family protein [Saprospiraceae bacterium]|nr:phosphatase PAP2 family protein [Saprospiraceae bacterium]